LNQNEFWKNFCLGLEVDASGAFIYNGIRHLDSLENLSHPIDIFEILYNLSVGIERLFKVGIILSEYNNQFTTESNKADFYTHSSIDLLDKLNSYSDLKLAKIHREFLVLLSEFYKQHRYGRFSISSVFDSDLEKKQFQKFLKKHLKLDIEEVEGGIYPFRNTDQIKKFMGKVVKRITDSAFNVIKDKASELNIYTYELRSDSKAVKVFHGDRLDFIDETRKKKEIILYLMSPKNKGNHIDLIRSFDPLKLDPEMTPYYIKSLLNEAHLPFFDGEIDDLYLEVKNVRERLAFLSVMDSDYLDFEPEQEK
jgi:CRISPR/Cas system-associated endoribonuclease Cas2